MAAVWWAAHAVRPHRARPDSICRVLGVGAQRERLGGRARMCAVGRVGGGRRTCGLGFERLVHPFMAAVSEIWIKGQPRAANPYFAGISRRVPMRGGTSLSLTPNSSEYSAI